MKTENKQKYHVLARGVVLSGGQLLVAHCKGMDNTFLPGGHVEFHEGIRQTLVREIGEELGLKSSVGAYLGVVETAYEYNGLFHQEINHLFQAELFDVDFRTTPASAEDHLEFYWIPIEAMEKHNLLPLSVRKVILQLVNGGEGSFFESELEAG